MASSTTFQCSPALHRRNGETCLPTSSLERLTRIWNNKYPRRKIPIGTPTRKNNRTTRNANLWSKLRLAIKQQFDCENEYCLVKRLPGIPKELEQSMLPYFRPEKPKEWEKKPRQWLDSYNIENVMNQYELSDPTFEFLGPVPIDFDTTIGSFGKCIVDELCKLDLEQAKKKGIQKIGIVFNLDKHNEPGSHWVCAFVDMPKRSAYYFDSYGYEPQKEIHDFLVRCKEQGCENVYYNDIRHQRKGSECGMYCLFVLICLLRGKAFYDICSNIIDDDTMASLRDILFATEKPSKVSIDKAIESMCILKQ